MAELAGFQAFLMGSLTIAILWLRSRRDRQTSATSANPEPSLQPVPLPDPLPTQQDIQDHVFTQLQTLLTNYPSARQMVQANPALPAKNLVALFTPLDALLQQWHYEAIGQPWQRVSFNPHLHQPDDPTLQPGDTVYIRFVGYRQGDRILCPAKVSRTLPQAALPS